jgi:hypothetical protein
MLKMRMIIFLIFILSLYAFAKDEDLKTIYRTVTNSINSAILTKKGNWELSGSGFFNKIQTRYKNYMDMDVKTVHAEPAVSYFIIDDLCLGLCLSYDYEKINWQRTGQKLVQTAEMKTEQKMVGVIGKKYFGSERWRPFIFADYLFHTGYIYKGSELNAGAGLLYHLAGSFGITADVKYGFFQSRDDDIEKRNRYYIGIGIVNFIF